MVTSISKNAWDKFNDPSYGSNGNTELDLAARSSMTPEQVWESLVRIDEIEGTTPK